MKWNIQMSKSPADPPWWSQQTSSWLDLLRSLPSWNLQPAVCHLPQLLGCSPQVSAIAFWGGESFHASTRGEPPRSPEPLPRETRRALMWAAMFEAAPGGAGGVSSSCTRSCWLPFSFSTGSVNRIAKEALWWRQEQHGCKGGLWMFFFFFFLYSSEIRVVLLVCRGKSRKMVK